MAAASCEEYETLAARRRTTAAEALLAQNSSLPVRGVGHDEHPGALTLPMGCFMQSNKEDNFRNPYPLTRCTCSSGLYRALLPLGSTSGYREQTGAYLPLQNFIAAGVGGPTCWSCTAARAGRLYSAPASPL